MILLVPLINREAGLWWTNIAETMRKLSVLRFDASFKEAPGSPTYEGRKSKSQLTLFSAFVFALFLASSFLTCQLRGIHKE